MKCMVKEKFYWKCKPRIVTYPNPRTLDKYPGIYELLSKYPHLCASDTLLMGLTQKYKRQTFKYIMTVDAFIESIFDGKLNGKEYDLQMFLDVSDAIDQMTYEEKTRSAFKKNKGQVVEAFKMLALLQYKWGGNCENEEKKAFFESVYEVLQKKYEAFYDNLVMKVDKKICKDALLDGVIRDVKYQLKNNELSNQREKAIKEILELPTSKNKEIEMYKTLIKNINKQEMDTIVVHGIARFTPEIMLMIKTLDQIGINIIFMINYVDNLPSLYSFWKKTYSWVGCEFEEVRELDYKDGNSVGRNIAQICEGIRPTNASMAHLLKYTTITDFTDNSVRREFEAATRKAKNIELTYKEKYGVDISISPLSHMKTQYYAVDASKPNDILRNYFPEQFMEKPFLSYPIGQFICALFNMWNFEEMQLEIDFQLLQECAAVKICHNNDNMVRVISDLKPYYSDVVLVPDVVGRGNIQAENLKHFSEKKGSIMGYLSYYSVSEKKIREFVEYINELNALALKIFGSNSKERVLFQDKFRELIDIVRDSQTSENALSKREEEVIQLLICSLGIKNQEPVEGGIKDLQDALYFYLSIKKNNSGADWIVRGFDQIDGAPLMKTAGRVYEFSMMSMKNMTKSVNEVLPWPLDEKIFEENNGFSIYLEQLKNIVDLRNEYLRFYFFYGAFFSKGAQIRFSYIENENDQKQRAYYLLDLLKLSSINNKSKAKVVTYNVKSDDYPIENIELHTTRKQINIFSICKYKFFLNYILGDKIRYNSDYHIIYFLENEVTDRVERKSKYNRKKLEDAMKEEIEILRKEVPYLDYGTISDIEKYVRSHFGSRRDELYMEKKRDFLNATWKNMETN